MTNSPDSEYAAPTPEALKYLVSLEPDAAMLSRAVTTAAEYIEKVTTQFREVGRAYQAMAERNSELELQLQQNADVIGRLNAQLEDMQQYNESETPTANDMLEVDEGVDITKPPDEEEIEHGD